MKGGMNVLSRISRLESVESRDSVNPRLSIVDARRERSSEESSEREVCSVSLPPKNQRTRDEKVFMLDLNGEWQMRRLILCNEGILITKPGRKLVVDQIDLVPG